MPRFRWRLGQVMRALKGHTCCVSRGPCSSFQLWITEGRHAQGGKECAAAVLVIRMLIAVTPSAAAAMEGGISWPCRRMQQHGDLSCLLQPHSLPLQLMDLAATAGPPWLQHVTDETERAIWPPAGWSSSRRLVPCTVCVSIPLQCI